MARACVWLVIGSEQTGLLPLHVPRHCLKRQPLAGVEVSRSGAYDETSDEHRGLQEIPGPELCTEPRPETDTVSRYAAGAKKAETVVSAATATLQPAPPAHAPPQRTSFAPEAGVALRARAVPALQVVVQLCPQRRPGTSAATEPGPEIVRASGT